MGNGILIGADIVPYGKSIEAFEKGNVEELVGKEIQRIIEEADFRIFNIECPLCDEKKPIAKVGPNLIAPIKTVNGIKALHTDLVTLANNHIMDQGKEGLESTINALRHAGISVIGAGKNLEEASQPFCFTYEKKKVCVYACTEHEFSVAGIDAPGANPIDFLDTPDQIASLKEQCDYLIVLYHGGKEYYRFPSPNLQKLFRKLADKGADLVVAQHTHCVGCEEKYKNSTLIYGQGNFIFDKKHDEFWDEGLLISIDNNFKVSYIPLRKCSLEDFKMRSQRIKEKGFVEKTYQEYSKQWKQYYLNRLYPQKSRVFKIINKMFNNIHKKYCFKHMDRLRIENTINCEAHRELFIESLKAQNE